MPNIIKTTHCLAAMSIKDHLMKLTMWWHGAQKHRNDRPGGRPPPLPPRQFRHCLWPSALGNRIVPPKGSDQRGTHTKTCFRLMNFLLCFVKLSNYGLYFQNLFFCDRTLWDKRVESHLFLVVVIYCMQILYLQLNFCAAFAIKILGGTFIENVGLLYA